MRFIIDGRYIQDHFPGIGRYVFNLAQALARIAPHENFRILYDPVARNTRYDVDSLALFENVALVPVTARTLSLREQLMGMNRALTAGEIGRASCRARVEMSVVAV